MKKFVCLILALLLCFGMLAACAEDGTEQPDSSNVTPTPDNTPEQNDPEDAGEDDYFSKLPTYNFNNDECVILCREDKEYEVDTDEIGFGDLINDAVFSRNARIEEAYQVQIISEPVEGRWPNRSVFMGIVRNAVNTGSGDYDLIAGYMAYTAEMAQEGLFLNMYEVENLNLENAWWSQSFNENMTIYDKLYFVDGDLSLTMWESLYAIYFNKQLAEDHGVEDLYQIVKDDEWTLERLYEITEDLYVDNGNDVKDMDDQYGMVINCHSVRALVTTCDIPVTARNDDGGYDLVFYTEKTADFFLNVYDFIHGNDAVYMMSLADDADYTDIIRMFTSNQTMFISGTLDQSAPLRRMDTDFGILPFPKYDEEQETYLAHSYDGHSIFCVPSSLVDTRVPGAILDAMGAESKQSVVPQYYEVVLKGRTTRDEASRDMLDIIRENLYFDFGFVYNNNLNKVWSQIGDMMERGTQIVASSFASQSPAFEKLLEELLEKFEVLP
jgi:ABC-type glycerol-3-phosphate transport system substrate-binding protein